MKPSATKLILLGTGGGPRPRKQSSAAAQVIVINGVSGRYLCRSGCGPEADWTGKRRLCFGSARYSYLLSVRHGGYRRTAGEYLKKSLPAVEFTYSDATPQNAIHDIDEESLENLPIGLDGSAYRWVDLDGKGISGILAEQGEGWYYKRNVSPINIVGTAESKRVEAKFDPVELVARTWKWRAASPTNSSSPGSGQQPTASCSVF